MKKIARTPLYFLINVRILNKVFTQLSCDPEKRDKALLSRALDFADAHMVFSGLHFTREDNRKDYGERRLITFGTLEGILVVLVWTDRFPAVHIISMRRANSRERKNYQVIHH